jgi:UDP-N-acetylglucosamine 2-epimerase (non-hydrolysing)
MHKVKIINVVGARPNFMKIAPVSEAMDAHPQEINHLLVHTGQHYDAKMSKAFFDDLGLPRPDLNLGVGSGTHAEQTGRVMIAFEKICLEHQPDLVVVVGDVNSTLACAVTAKKVGIPVAHVEAGLRSGDMSMPEEINRLCTDVIADFLFTTDHLADANLRRQGVAEENIHFVGNVMIDTLLKHRRMAEQVDILERWSLEKGGYALLTLHRPSNVDDPATLEGIFEALNKIAAHLPIVFPIHPRTAKTARRFGLEHYLNRTDTVKGVWCTDPLGYLTFLHLNMHAKMVLTDSGGIQEETTVLGVPCITLRHNTERPITCEQGTNVIVGNDPDRIVAAAERILAGDTRKGRVPEKWDGHAAERIVAVLRKKIPKDAT